MYTIISMYSFTDVYFIGSVLCSKKHTVGANEQLCIKVVVVVAIETVNLAIKLLMK